MHSTNLFKSCIYIFVASILMASFYFYINLISNGVIQNYSKATWYYEYNQVNIDFTSSKELKEEFPTLLGYLDERTFHLEDKEVKMYQLVNEISLDTGRMVYGENDIIISQEIADRLMKTYNLISIQELMDKEIFGYRICGITNIQMENNNVVYIKEISNSTTQQLLFSPETNMELLHETYGFSLNQYDKVIVYIQKIMKALVFFTLLSLFILGLDLVLTKVCHLKVKATMICNVLAMILSMGMIYMMSNKLNSWLTVISYLHLPIQWSYLFIPCLITIVLNLGIKKIKFFQ